MSFFNSHPVAKLGEEGGGDRVQLWKKKFVYYDKEIFWIHSVKPPGSLAKSFLQNIHSLEYTKHVMQKYSNPYMSIY